MYENAFEQVEDYMRAVGLMAPHEYFQLVSEQCESSGVYTMTQTVWRTSGELICIQPGQTLPDQSGRLQRLHDAVKRIVPEISSVSVDGVMEAADSPGLPAPWPRVFSRHYVITVQILDVDTPDRA